MREYEVIRTICEKLWDSEDSDCALAEEYGFKDQIIMLFAECYDYEYFCEWLAKNNCNPAEGFSNAEINCREDYDSDEEFEEAKDDALFYNDDYICIRW